MMIQHYAEVLRLEGGEIKIETLCLKNRDPKLIPGSFFAYSIYDMEGGEKKNISPNVFIGEAFSLQEVLESCPLCPLIIQLIREKVPKRRAFKLEEFGWILLYPDDVVIKKIS